VAGDRATTVRDVIGLASARFGIDAPAIVAPRLLDEALAQPMGEAQRRALDRARVYFPYFALRVRFDDRSTRQALAGAGVHAPPLADYFDALMDYAERESWGRAAELSVAA
jgi:hypothetical protein